MPAHAAAGSCISRGRLLFCRGAQRRRPEVTKPVPAGNKRIIVDIAVKDRDLAAKLLSGSWVASQGKGELQDRLTLLGPVSQEAFDDSGRRLTEVALPQLGRWARWRLWEREARDCGEGGVTWAMAVVLANLVGTLPEYPRLRVLEVGAGAGLVALTLAGRGHEVVASDGSECVLKNLRENVGGASFPGQIRPLRLRWHVEEDRTAAAALGSFDMIVGADLLYDRPNCDALRAVLRRLLSGSSEAIFAERDLAGHASRCASTLRLDGLDVEELPSRPGAAAASVNGRGDPRPLRVGAAAPLVLRLRRHWQ